MRVPLRWCTPVRRRPPGKRSDLLPSRRLARIGKVTPRGCSRASAPERRRRVAASRDEGMGQPDMNGRSRIFIGALFAGYAALTGCQASVGSNAPLALGERDVEAITSDDFFVYWATASGLVKRVSLDGGKVEQLASGAAGPALMAADEHDLFVAFGDGSVNRIPKKGGEPVVLATSVGIRGIATDATHVYYTDGSSLRSVDKSGSPDVEPVTLSVGLTDAGDVAVPGLGHLPQRQIHRAGRPRWWPDVQDHQREDGGARALCSFR